jgi:hypothetical protein
VIAPTFTVSGVISRVTSTGSVVPFEGVDVYAGRKHATTDATGYYSIDGLTGAITIAVNKDGYKKERTTVPFIGDTRFDLQLVRLRRYTLSGGASQK